MLDTAERVLLEFLELTGKEWEESRRPEDIRLSVDAIKALRSVNSLVADRGLDAQLLREKCPSFVSVYRAVMLREIEELIPNGTDETGANPG